MKLTFRTAHMMEIDTVFRLYSSVIGRGFCTWNNDYPTRADLAHDIETDNLYLMFDDGELIGAAAVVPENELDDLSCWDACSGIHRELARVVVTPMRQGAGFAKELVRRMLSVLSERDCTEVRLLVATENLPAVGVYSTLGFDFIGDCNRYGNSYHIARLVLKNGDFEWSRGECVGAT